MTAVALRATRSAPLLEDRLNRLIDLWQELGAHGPTFGSPVAGRAEDAACRYLRPLAPAYSSARGSAEHAAVYLEERLRHAPGTLSAAQRRDLITGRFSADFPAVARLVTNPSRSVSSRRCGIFTRH
jgi:hypothetical protein